MKKESKRQGRELRQLIILISSFALVLAVVLLFSVRDMNSIAEKIIHKQMRDNSKNVSAVISVKLSDSLNVLKYLAATISDYDDIQGKEALLCLRNAISNTTFNRMRIANAQGIAIDADRITVDISGREYFHAGLAGSSGITNALKSVYNNEKITILYVPVIKDNTAVGVAYGVYEYPDLSHIISESNISELTNTIIMRPNGDLIFGSSLIDGEILQYDNNVFDFLAMQSYDNGFSSDMIIDDIANGRNGHSEFYINGSRKVCFYNSFPQYDYSILQFVDYNDIDQEVYSINLIAYVMTAMVSAIFIALITIMVIRFKNSYRQVVNSNRQITSLNRRFEVAIKKMVLDFFEYRVNDDKLLFLSDRSILMDNPLNKEYGLDEFISLFALKYSDANEIKSAISEIKRGSESAERVFEQLDEHKVKYIKLTITGSVEDDTYFGTFEDYTNVKQNEILTDMNKKYRWSGLYDCIIAFEIDLTENLYLNITNELNDVTKSAYNEWMPYSENAERIGKLIVSEEDMETFSFYSSREYLLRLFDSGRYSVTIEYRMKYKNKNEIWVSSTTRLLQDPETGHIKAYVYVKDINTRKTKELQLEEKANHDDLTGVLLRSSFISYTEEFIRELVDETKFSAMLIIDFDDFKGINDMLGHASGDKVLVHGANVLKSYSAENTIAARMGGDEFLMLLKNYPSVTEIKAFADGVAKAISKIEKNIGRTVSVTIGMTLIDKESDFKTIYRQADTALYYAKENNLGGYCLFSELPENEKEHKSRKEIE